MRIRGLDISDAFMHSPVLKMPLPVSMLDGSVAYLSLDKALNGLRDASGFACCQIPSRELVFGRTTWSLAYTKARCRNVAKCLALYA